MARTTDVDDPEALSELLADATAEADGTLIGGSVALSRVRELIDKAAAGSATVLVRGETGTGKELVARAVHDKSSRSAGPFVVLHCAALPDSLLESELFGHEKGAFTGAFARKLGRVELANGGTLFLDEIGDVTPATQVKLLRLLQERSFERVGGTESRKADLRFVAATHRDLESMVKRGEFREDLFYRLNVVPVWVPPLRGRRDDIEPLARAFVERFATENDKPGLGLTEEAMLRLRAQRWPGNVRQLQNLIERLVVLASSKNIDADDIDRELAGHSPFVTEIPEAVALTGITRPKDATPAAAPTVPEAGGGTILRLDAQLRAAEKRAIEHALRVAEGNRTKAARLLGVSRQTLYNKLKEHGLAGHEEG